MVHEANGYGDTLAGLLVFAAYTGLRPGELYALRHDDLGAETLEVKRAADSRTRAITLPKNGRARTVVYPARAREAVASVPRLAGVDLVFPSVTGAQLWATSFKWAWTPVRAAFGRPTMALHELVTSARRTCSSSVSRRRTWRCSWATPMAARSS